MKYSREHAKAVYAQLLEHFHLTPEQILKLTDRQIMELYFHPRDNAGAIKPETPAPDMETLEGNLMLLDLLAANRAANKDVIEAKKAELREKWPEIEKRLKRNGQPGKSS